MTTLDSPCWQIEPAAAAAYLDVCRRATDSPDWAAFKRDPAYTRVLEHVTQEQGCAYLEIICAEYPELMYYLGQFGKNDRLGDPHLARCVVWDISPTTLRYIKVLGDLLNWFDALDDLDIVEIGGGYGGQCKIVADVCRFRSYTLVDLPVVTRLQTRYLTELDVRNWQVATPDALPDRPYDLAISNYAVSELDAEGQAFYFGRVLRRSRRGYLTWNGRALPALEGLPGQVWVENERPQTGEHNRLIVWGAR
jgi:putative sugar O-methyltransferase